MHENRKNTLEKIEPHYFDIKLKMGRFLFLFYFYMASGFSCIVKRLTKQSSKELLEINKKKSIFYKMEKEIATSLRNTICLLLFCSENSDFNSYLFILFYFIRLQNVQRFFLICTKVAQAISTTCLWWKCARAFFLKFV